MENVDMQYDIDVPSSNESSDDPWVQFAGMWQDDPDWEQFQSDIERFRRETVSSGNYPEYWKKLS